MRLGGMDGGVLSRAMVPGHRSQWQGILREEESGRPCADSCEPEAGQGRWTESGSSGGDSQQSPSPGWAFRPMESQAETQSGCVTHTTGRQLGWETAERFASQPSSLQRVDRKLRIRDVRVPAQAHTAESSESRLGPHPPLRGPSREAASSPVLAVSLQEAQDAVRSRSGCGWLWPLSTHPNK